MSHLLTAGLLVTALTAIVPSSNAAAISTANLVARWSFDQSSGTSVTNNAGVGYNGTFAGTPTWTSGKISNALSFNGTDYVDIGNVTQISNARNVTLAGWMKRNSSTGQVILAKHTTNHEFGIGALSDGKVHFKVSNGSNAGGTITLNDTNWHHVALVFNGSLVGNSNRLKAYVDGTQRSLTYIGTVPTATTINTTPFRMGRAGTNYSDGVIDDVWLFARTLSVSEVQELATPPPSDTQAPSVPTGLAGQAASSTQVNLSWSASTDNVGVTSYGVYRNSQLVGTPNGTTFTDNGLSPNTSYSYRVAARDAATNQSAQSSPISVTTPGQAAAPTVDLTVSPSQVGSGGSVTLSWSSTGATGCTAADGWSGGKPMNGSETVSSITSARTFVLTCTGAGGQTSDSASVAVLAQCNDGLDNDSDGLADLSDPGCVDGNDNDESDSVGTTPTNGPLRKSTNGRYFMDDSGETIVLNGSHTWLSLQDVSGMPAFDYQGYLDVLDANRHNFFRLWVWEQAMGISGGGDLAVSPLPYQRTGPGTAYDGLPKFDLTRLNQAYFDRMRARVVEARDRGIYVSIMLFNGFSVVHKNGGQGNPCNGHPYNGANNVNNVNVASNGSCGAAHTLANAQVTALQDAYVTKVIDTVADLDNVLFEISNESETNSTAWQYRMINFIKSAEASQQYQHPVGMTFQYPGGSNSTLFNSPADWISPNGSGGYSTNPPAASGQKVVVLDTDHIWGIGGDYSWLWRSIARGYSVLYMDCWVENFYGGCDSAYVNGSVRRDLLRNLGYARTLLDRTDLATLSPQSSLASSGFALARTGSGGEYVVYKPSGTTVSVNLTSTPGTLVTEWLNPLTGAITTGSVAGGGTRTITAPFSGAGVLYVHP